MKLSEAIAVLESVRTAQFEATLSDGKRAVLYYDEGYFMIDFTYNGKKVDYWMTTRGAFKGGINVKADLEWRIVREPVNWKEAIEAWSRGKVVRVVHPDYEFRLDYKTEFTPEMIRYAKWYVED